MRQLVSLFSRRDRWAALGVIGWGVGAAALGAVSNPIAIKLLFDQATMRGNFRVFLALAVASVMVFTVWRFLELHYRLAKQRLGQRLLTQVAAHLLETFYRLPFARVLAHDSGYFVARVHDESEAVVLPGLNLAADVARALATLLVAGVLLLTLAPTLTLALLLVSPGLLWLSRRSSARIYQQTQAEQEAAADLRGAAAASVSAFKTVRLFDLQDLALGLYRRRFARYVGFNYARSRDAALYSTLGSTFLSVLEMAVIVAGGYGVMTGRLSFGGLMAFMSAFWMATGAVQGLVDAWPTFANLRAAAARLHEFEGFAGAARGAAAGTGGEVRLEAVSFSYGSGLALRPFSARLERGRSVLLEGENGSGKSTLAHLIAGLLPADAGESQLPARVSAVIEPMVFPLLPLQDLIAAVGPEGSSGLIDAFGLRDLLQRAPDHLSLGQLKKFGVLMGLLRPADCYVFDEPLANLDAASEQIVLDAIFEQTAGRTLIVIMHGAARHRHRFDQVWQLSGREPVAAG